MTIDEVKSLMAQREVERKKRIDKINAVLKEAEDSREAEFNALCQIFGIDKDVIEEAKKEYPMPIYKTEASKFIQSEEFRIKGKMIRSFLGEDLPLPTTSTLIVGKNKLGKTPVLNYWKEILDNRIMDIRRQEEINFQSGMQFWQLDEDLRKCSNILIDEPELYTRFEDGDRTDYSTRSGYLFLDDIFQETIWKDTTNFKHDRFLVHMTKMYQNIRDRYSDRLVVVATTNNMPTKEALAGDARIQSRVLGTFAVIINTEKQMLKAV